ncbi:leucine rich repeat protein, partial [Phyllosticta citriasiana]|uniref:leucine rich repeat protein n=1 Tax=Phyllosticta citriasiana TaxID=595635 RepID=UPI0030FD4EE6
GTPPGPGTGTVLPPNLVRDRAIIQAFAKTVTGDPLHITSTWQGENPCLYKGFVCDKNPNTGVLSLAGVDFNEYLLRGQKLFLKGFLDKLVDLAIFHANSNGFRIPVPPSLAQLPYLYELDLSNNYLTGKLPPGVLTAKKLTFLDLRFNYFRGSIPGELFYPDLDVLFLNNNGFDGSIPTDIGGLRALYVTFANNLFTGSIPEEITIMPYLIEILLEHNKFTGSLPTEFGRLKSMTLFDASNNQLSGTIPESLCGLPNIRSVVLKNNQFTEDLGPICLKALQMNKLDV